MKLVRRMGLGVCGLILLLPVQAFAEGTHPEEDAGISWGTYVLIAFTVLLIVTSTVYLLQKKRLDGLKNAKRPEDRALRVQLSSRVTRFRWVWVLSLTGLLLTAVINLIVSQNTDNKVSMADIHGIGYSSDGQKLIFAAHDGLKLYSQGHWSTGAGEKNDYMGFSIFDKGFYASGHPGPGSKLKNPLGVVRSLDEGKSVEPLAYHGQMDFHLMTAGYKTQTLYVFNPQPTSQMKEPGLYYSNDDAKTWSKSEMNGLQGEPAVIAAHPLQSSVLAIGTVNGVYLSKDNGNTFESLFTGKQITSLSYSPQGVLYAGTFSQKQGGLMEIKQDTKETKEIVIPKLDNNAIAYLAVNQRNEKEISYVTFEWDAFLSSDLGGTWNQIVSKGKSAP